MMYKNGDFMVDVLLACYNGEKYISQQIDSIIAQTFTDWHLIIQDDCSTDNTVEIVKSCIAEHQDKITLYQRETPSGSAKNNFLSMLSLAESEYIMFSDQDDYWLEDKIAVTFVKMKRLESENADVPLLVHTDLSVADRELNITSSSFFKFQGLDKKAVSFNKLLAQNNVTGCTMMINRQLLDIVKYDENILMHDWWFALIASSMGKIGFVDKATILYRQHSRNELGAVNNRNLGHAASVARDKSKAKLRLTVTYLQAQDFMKIYSDILPYKSHKLAQIYTAISNKCKATRILYILRYNFTKQNIVTKIGQLILC